MRLIQGYFPTWCMFSWFYLPWNVNLGNFIFRDPWPEGSAWWFVKNLNYSWPIFRDFITLFLVILRHKSSKWLERLYMHSDLGMRFAMWSLDLAIFAILLSSNSVSSVRTGYLYLIFVIRKTNFCFRDSWSVILYFFFSFRFLQWTVCEN